MEAGAPNHVTGAGIDMNMGAYVGNTPGATAP